jgi:hypothetical protein
VPKLSTEVSILIDSASHWLSRCPSRWPPRLLTTIYARVSLGRSREDRRIHFFRDFHQRHRRIFAGVRRPTANVLSELSEDTATGPVAVISTEPYCTVGAGIAEEQAAAAAAAASSSRTVRAPRCVVGGGGAAAAAARRPRRRLSVRCTCLPGRQGGSAVDGAQGVYALLRRPVYRTPADPPSQPLSWGRSSVGRNFCWCRADRGGG